MAPLPTRHTLFYREIGLIIHSHTQWFRIQSPRPWPFEKANQQVVVVPETGESPDFRSVFGRKVVDEKGFPDLLSDCRCRAGYARQIIRARLVLRREGWHHAVGIHPSM
jgi:hypothetical protein